MYCRSTMFALLLEAAAVGCERGGAVCDDPVGVGGRGADSVGSGSSSAGGADAGLPVVQLRSLPAVGAGAVDGSAPGDASAQTQRPSGPCIDCTRTQGYWKNHPASWPVARLSVGDASYTRDALVALFETPPAGDASLTLVHQLVAARLNVLHGASEDAVATTFVEADAWMAAHADADGRLPYGIEAATAAEAQAVTLAGTLEAFNEGAIGPGHCP